MYRSVYVQIYIQYKMYKYCWSHFLSTSVSIANDHHCYLRYPASVHQCWKEYCIGLVSFSRMRSEGFPFIVGVWGWTCVRVVLVVSSSCRRRQLVNSLPLGRASGGVLEDLLCRVKFEGSLARNARFGSSKCPDGRSFSCFAWQVQYFRGVSISACHFGVAGAALCNVTFCICVAGAAFCDVLKVFFS